MIELVACLFTPRSVSYPTDGAADAFTTICHFDNGPESSFMPSDQCLSNGGGLIRRRSKVMAESVFSRRGKACFCTIDVFCRALLMSQSLYRMTCRS